MSTKVAEQNQQPAEDELAAEEVEQTPAQITEAVESAADAPAAAEPVSPDLETLQTQLEAARTEAAQNLDGWQRATAELANYKRRQEEQAARRKEEITGQLVAQLFPALDDLDLAFSNVPASVNEHETNWVEGFKLVQRKLLKLLESHRVEIIPATGEFDPNLHEAITHEENPDFESNAIIAELRKGYKLGDRVLRPSLVRVAQ